jgi:hypothetical protein
MNETKAVRRIPGTTVAAGLVLSYLAVAGTPAAAAHQARVQLTALGSYTSRDLSAAEDLLSRMARLSPERLAKWNASLVSIAAGSPVAS